MAKVTFSRKEFEKSVKITKEIEERISMFGTPLESLNDEEVEIEIFPNRPDLLSLQGYLRAFKAFIGKSSGVVRYKTNKPKKGFEVKIMPSVKDIRAYTACAIIKGISFSKERIRDVIEMQEKLHATIGRNRKKLAIGIYPLEKIKLPIKYEARKPSEIRFVPLEMNQEMNGLQILHRHPTGKEYAHLLEGFEKFPVFVDSAGKILSMPPVINSNETGKITEHTKDVFIECSGSDFGALKKTLNIIAATLADMGGKIYQMELDYGKKEFTPDLTPEKMKISLDNANSLLGLKLSEKELERLLQRMGYDYSRGNVLIPAWRTDILHEVDIIEDILIAYGYDKLEPEIPKVATIGEEDKNSKIKRSISEILSGLKLIEISSYHLIKQDEAEKSGLSENSIIEIANSKTEYKYLRPSLLTPALRVLSENKDSEYPQNIFEIGKVFEKEYKMNSETGITEKENLAIALCPSNFTQAKQVLDCLMHTLSMEYGLKESPVKDLIDGRAGTIIINGARTGHIGEIHPEILRNFNVKMPVSIIEISLDEIFNALSESE